MIRGKELLNMHLFKACELNDADRLKDIIDAGADVNAESPEGNPILHSAWYAFDRTILSLFIEAGANVNIQNYEGNTLLHLTCEGKNIKTVRLLIDAGADTNVKNDEGRTPLHYACWEGDCEVIKQLIDAGVDVNAKDKYGRTPLHSNGILSPNKKMVAFLIEAGADVNTRDNKGCTVLHTLIKNRCDTEIRRVPFTINYATTEEYANNGGVRTKTTYIEDVGAVKFFIEKGVDINIEDNDGCTALDYAYERGHTNIIRLLKGVGAK